MHRSIIQTDRGLTVEYLREVWSRRKWIAVTVFAAVLATVASVTLSLPYLYRATATVSVEKQQVSEAFVRSTVTAELETRIQTIRQHVMSRDRLVELISRLGLYPELRKKWPADALVDRMRRDVRLDLAGADSSIGRGPTIAFTVSYIGRDPQTVAHVANTLVSAYIEENTKSRTSQVARTAEILRTQLAEAKQELDARERRASELKSRHTGELPEQLPANIAALDRVATQLRLNGEYQLRAIERRERLERQLAEAATTPPAATVADDPDSAQLSKLREELAELRRQFSDQYPDVIRVKAQVAALEQRIASSRTNGHAPQAGPADPAAHLKRALADVDNELRSLSQEDRTLRQVMAGYEARVENSPRRQQELEELARGSEVTKERYETLLKQYQEALLAEDLEKRQDVEQFRVLEPAMPPDSPAAPNRLGLLVLGFMAAVVLALAAPLGAEKLDTTFHTVDDLRSAIHVPTLATIRLIPTKSDLRRRRWRFALMAVIVALGVGLLATGAHYLADGNEQVVRRIPGALR
jgi:polysaccharide biosynthesis transport protein